MSYGSRATDGPHGAGDPDHMCHRPDVVDAYDTGAAGEREQRGGDRAFESPAGRLTEQAPQEALARYPDHDRKAERDDLLDAGEQRQVVSEVLGEADAGIDGDRVARNAGGERRFGTRGQEALHLANDVVVARLAVHGARRTLAVHQDDRRT